METHELKNSYFEKGWDNWSVVLSGENPIAFEDRYIPVERSNPKNFTLNGIVYNGSNLYVAVGEADGADTYIITSPDRITWTERAAPLNLRLNKIAYKNTGIFKYVAVGEYDAGSFDAYVVVSQDGIIWNQAAGLLNTDLYDIAWNGSNLFVAPAGYLVPNAYVETSPDGVNWTSRVVVSKSKNLYGVCYGNGLWVVVGEADGSDALLATSSDGITWTERSNPKNITLNDVYYDSNGGIYVAVGESDGIDAYIITSHDGITWTERANSKNITLNAITYNDSIDLFIAVGETDGTKPYIITSPNGINWTEQISLKNFALNDVITYNTDNNYLAVGDADGTDAYMQDNSSTNALNYGLISGRESPLNFPTVGNKYLLLCRKFKPTANADALLTHSISETYAANEVITFDLGLIFSSLSFVGDFNIIVKIENTTIFTFDATNLSDGVNSIRLAATNTSELTGQLKIGYDINYTSGGLSIEWLSIDNIMVFNPLLNISDADSQDISGVT